jgi:preprotein translocase subunit SecE
VAEKEVEKQKNEGGVSDRRQRRGNRRRGGAAADMTSSTAKETATRSRRDAEVARTRAASSAGENLPVVGGLVSYFRGVAAEIRKVTWPTTEEAVRLTRIVVMVMTAAAIILGLFDLLYGVWFEVGLENELLYIAIAIAFVVIGGGASYMFIFREES